jgi:hypothetical protein
MPRDLVRLAHRLNLQRQLVETLMGELRLVTLETGLARVRFIKSQLSQAMERLERLERRMK